MAGPAGAHGTTPYSVVVSPATAAAGARVEFKATFTNRSEYAKLGSANLTAPSRFSVVRASVPAPATATLSGNVVQLRNLGLRPWKSVTVTVVADVPCAAGDKTWSVVARRTADFTGSDSGPLVYSKLTTTVTGSCAPAPVALRFVNQPAGARVDETITTSPYNTPPGGAVTVEVVDTAGHRVTTSSAVVTMSLAPGSSTGALSGTKVVTAVNGLATFADLSIDTQGSYMLLARSPELASATSESFRIDEAATVCAENVACTATLADPDASLAVSAPSSAGADSGVLTINRGPGLDCDGYDELLDRDFAVDFLPDAGAIARSKTVTLMISREVMKASPNNGVAHLNMCFGAPFEFAVKPGTPPLQEHDGLFVGLLPDCGTAPCVSKRKGHGGGAIIEVRAPGGDQDPRYNG